jgi:hypothetical protein
MPAPTTPPDQTLSERYADLIGAAGVADPAGHATGGDPALIRLVAALDLALQARPAPPEVYAALARPLHEGINTMNTPPPANTTARVPGTLSRRDALKAGAASMTFLLRLGNIGPELAAELSHLAQEQARQGPMTGARLVGILQTERARWNALLAQVGLDRMEEPGVEGEWSLKELIAHLTWYERAVVAGARQVMSTGTFSRPQSGLHALEMDERNARIAAQSRARPVGDVLAEAEQVFSQLVAAIAASPEDLLNDPKRMGLPDDVVPWMLVANNAYAHYREHEQSIRAWLARQGEV